MFQDHNIPAVEFPSCWKKEKSSSDAHTQTSEVLANEAETQTSHTSSIAVQTEEVAAISHVLVIDNSPSLKDFLKRVEPYVCEQLRRNVESSAFDGYWVEWEEEETKTTCIYTLTETSLNSEFHCTGLSWNSTGSVLAASFGRFDHETWCSHKSMLCTWNLDRTSIDSKRAHVTIDTPSCMMCLACHPEHPALVAGGLFSGEVMVWSCGKDGDPLLFSSGLTEPGHKEPLSQVCWVDGPQGERQHQPYRLLSLGSDGLLLVWRCPRQGFQQLTAVISYRLTADSVPRHLRAGRAHRDTAMGGTSLSFSTDDKSMAVVGCENGCLLKCSLQTDSDMDLNSDLSAEGERDVMKNPITFAFRPHQGPVYGCSCSPFHRNLFLTASTDMSIHLYSLLDSSPLLCMEPDCGYLFNVQWSPTRPLVYAIGCADGHVVIYDLNVSHVKPSEVLDASHHQRPVHSLQYNIHRPQLLASGDASGLVKVWRLGSSLTAQVPGEMEQLASLVTATPPTASL